MYSQENYKKKIIAVTAELEGKLIEREEIIRLILLAIFSKHHAFLIGLPGVAKTRLLKVVANVFSDGSFWEILMTKETREKNLLGEEAEDDNFGKLLNLLDHKKISEYQNSSNDGYLKHILSFLKLGKHVAKVESEEEIKKKTSMLHHPFILFDEMFKASDDLLVSCLPMLNERYYTNKGKATPVPLNSLFSASNELPEGEKIEPFADRILIWYEVKRIQKKENWLKYIDGTFDTSKETITKFSMEEIEFCHISANDVTIPEEIKDLYTRLENNIYKDGIRVSNRKFGPEYIIRALKVCAWLNGRSAINESDMLLTRHMAWQNFIEKNKLENVIHDTIFNNPAQVESIINGILKEFEEAHSYFQSEVAMFTVYAVDLYGAEGSKNFDSLMNKLSNYAEASMGMLNRMRDVFKLYEYSLVVQKQVRENIFLVDYTSRTFEKKEVLNSVEIFISDREAEYTRLSEWYGNNKTMSNYQENRNKVGK